MLIDESGLIRAIKDAWAHGGYNIMNSGEQIVIYSERWFVRCDWSKLPRKALALAVEHLGMLPEDGAAFTVTKKADVQTMIPEILGEDVAGWMSQNASEREEATMVPVMFRGYQLYQAEGGGACYGVSPIALAIVERTIAKDKTALVMENRTMRWSHDGELVVIPAVRPSAAYWAKEWEKEVWDALEGVDLHRKEE